MCKLWIRQRGNEPLHIGPLDNLTLVQHHVLSNDDGNLDGLSSFGLACTRLLQFNCLKAERPGEFLSACPIFNPLLKAFLCRISESHANEQRLLTIEFQLRNELRHRLDEVIWKSRALLMTNYGNDVDHAIRFYQQSGQRRSYREDLYLFIANGRFVICIGHF